MRAFTLSKDEVMELIPHLEMVAAYAAEFAIDYEFKHVDQLDRLIDLMKLFLKYEERVEA